MTYLVRKLKERKVLVLDDEFLHVRCCAHILNLIVGDALKNLHVSIVHIRNVVKYVRSSPTRLQIFKDFAEEDSISTKSCLTMDVPTGWNSTFTMFDGAIKFQKTFERLEDHDRNYIAEEIDGEEEMLHKIGFNLNLLMICVKKSMAHKKLMKNTQAYVRRWKLHSKT